MDTEQQIRLSFLDEAEEYFDLMESNLLGLADSVIEAPTVDLILRCAHSIKGGAGMMNFTILSQVAHRTEDFLKILRVRHVSQQIETEVETLMLESLDCLRHIADLHRQGQEVIESNINQRIQPVFDRLQEHLGELETADENALLAQNEDFDPAVLIFEEGVDGVLDGFENKLSELGIAELTQALTSTAQELVGFGMMASLDPFVQLCESIQEQVASISPEEIKSLAEQALKTWKRSHALVLRGSIERLPSHLEGYSPRGLNDSDRNIEIELGTEAEKFDPLEVDSFELSSLQSAFDLDTSEAPEEEDFDPLEADSFELGSLQSAFESESFADTTSKIPSKTEEPSNLPILNNTPAVEQIEKMVRVPASQLKQFNSLFEQLVSNRNSIHLRLEQLQNAVFLMSQRMSQMESSNTQLKQWYDRASIEGLLSEKEQLVSTSTKALNNNSDNNNSDRFDSLEMDRYSDINLICQEQIETIVQLQEVATDIELGVQEVNQSVRDLHYTTKSMQGNVTRTQMLPFADAVKRLPRIIRDLNLKLDKKVNLKILGERTLLDRSVIEALNDPLMHLLRNSFDHGIEDTQTRLENGKTTSGTITIEAKNIGTYSVITVSDDGGGISHDKIRDRISQMGLSTEEVAQIPEVDLLEFIFEPGFSTAEQVTQLSGRGVGMDVVKTNLQEVRGDIRVDTKPGKGTTFTLRIPFSLSILRVAIVEQGGFIFAIPASNIRELIPCPPEDILATEDSKNIAWNLTEIPLIEIEKILVYRRPHHHNSLTGNPTINQPMTLVVGDDKSYRALKISRFWDEQESTIRSIDSPVPLPPGVISSVVFGDGKVIPLIDPLELVEAGFKDIPNLTPTKISDASAIKTILIVDDSINVRRYLIMTLEKAGYRVEEAKDGQEAVDKLLNGLKVQAVICDLEMPRLDGYGVLEEIKERPEFQHLPIAMLTSRSNEKHLKLAMNLGASAYFAKPYNEKELIDKLAELVLS